MSMISLGADRGIMFVATAATSVSKDTVILAKYP